MSGGARKNADSLLIGALAGGATRARAAEAASVSEATVYRRLQDNDFCRQVQAARSEMVDQVVGTLMRAGPAAVMTLVKLLGARSEMAQLGAARSLLELGGKWREAETLEARICALEERLAAQQSPTTARQSWAA